MSVNSTRCTLPGLIYIIILVGLFYAFHVELFITGVRLYATVVDSPRAERLLGDYYRSNAQLSNNLSLTFYLSAMDKYKKHLAAATPIEQANIKLHLGRFYLCGKGVLPNETEAKHWFIEAEQAADSAARSGESHTQLMNEIKEAIIVASTPPTGSPNNSPICQNPTEMQFILNMFKAP